MMKSVIVCGTLAYDLIFKYDKSMSQHFNKDTNNISVSFLSKTYEKFYGGTASNVAYGLSLLDIKSHILSSAGNDFYEFKKWLNKHNISTDWVIEPKNQMTPTCVIINDANNNQVEVFYQGQSENYYKLSLLDKDISAFSYAVITPTDVEAMYTHAKECRQMNIPYMFDPGFRLEHFNVNNLLFCCENSDILIMNEHEYKTFLGIVDFTLEQALKLTTKTIITRGSKGSTLYRNNQVLEIPIVKCTKIEDTTGAGDAYKSGVVMGILNNFDIEYSCKFGSVVSSFKVEANGSMGYSFNKKDFIGRYSKQFPLDNETINKLKIIV